MPIELQEVLDPFTVISISCALSLVASLAHRLTTVAIITGLCLRYIGT